MGKQKRNSKVKSRTAPTKKITPAENGNPFVKPENFEAAKPGRPREEKAVVIKLKPTHIVAVINLLPRDDFQLLDVRMQLIKAVTRHGTPEQIQKIIL